jgi:hypothetical protein
VITEPTSDEYRRSLRLDFLSFNERSFLELNPVAAFFSESLSRSLSCKVGSVQPEDGTPTDHQPAAPIAQISQR